MNTFNSSPVSSKKKRSSRKFQRSLSLIVSKEELHDYTQSMKSSWSMGAAIHESKSGTNSKSQNYEEVMVVVKNDDKENIPLSVNQKQHFLNEKQQPSNFVIPIQRKSPQQLHDLVNEDIDVTITPQKELLCLAEPGIAGCALANFGGSDANKELKIAISPTRKRKKSYDIVDLSQNLIELDVEENKGLKRNNTSTCFADFREYSETNPSVSYYSESFFPHINGFQGINVDKLCQLMESVKSKDCILVDCRYPYEYNGGHIKGSVNIYDPTTVQEFFFPECPNRFMDISSKFPILYCEHSKIRSPRIAMKIRYLDRLLSKKHDELVYSEIGLLQEGYRAFFKYKKQYCEPQGYVPMSGKKSFSDFPIMPITHLLRNMNCKCFPDNEKHELSEHPLDCPRRRQLRRSRTAPTETASNPFLSLKTPPQKRAMTDLFH